MAEIAAQIAHVVAGLVFGYGVLAGYRSVRQRSDVMGIILATGILIRVAFGLALFWISYLHLPFAESLQSGRGFWELAVDARHYYDVAVAAIDAHSFAIDPLAPSPFYVWVLTLWLFIVGVSPAAAMLLNLGLYVALAVVVVRLCAPVNEWRRDLPCVVFLTAYSFSPVILIHSTQPLKDELFNVLLAAACLGVLPLRRLVHQSADPRQDWWIAAGALTLAIATYGATGIRWYYGFIIWCGLALVLAMFTVRGRTMPLRRYLLGSLVVLSVAWLGFWAGSGRFYFAAAGLRTPTQLYNITALARAGFLMSGGGTNIVTPLREDPMAGQVRYAELLQAQRTSPGAAERAAAEQAYTEIARNKGLATPPVAATPASVPAETATATAPAAAPTATTPSSPSASAGGPQLSSTPASGGASTPPAMPAPTAVPGRLPLDEIPAEVASSTRAVPITIREHVITVARGVAVVFVPVAILHTVSDVRIEGGRGLLSLVDVDTTFLDVASILVLTLLWKRRDNIGDRLPFVVFGLLLAAISAVLLGYVVTNFGTLWRLRSLIAVPLWILVVAVATRTEAQAERTGAAARAVAG